MAQHGRAVSVAYATTYDGRDVRNWSGLGRYIGETLESQGFRLDYVDVSPSRAYGLLAAADAVSRLTGRSSSQPERTRPVVRSSGRRLRRHVAASAPDLVFSPGTLALGAFDFSRPTMFWADATFAAMLDFYPDFRSLGRRTRERGLRLDSTVLERCDAAFYASEWAARSAVEDHGADPAKVHVVPFGANLQTTPSPAEVRRMVERRLAAEMCELVFVGVDWARKGGDTALAVAECLNDRGVPTRLTVVGCEAPRDVPFVEATGFLDKREADRELVRRLARSHFLVLPSRAECFGVVFCEASAFGVPSLAPAVGGVPSAVRDGRNGRLFAPDAGPDEYADFVEDALGRYEGLALSSLEEYRTRLNWETAGAAVRRVALNTIEPRARAAA
jgi:glycosyltransferase involved in cell wall biosynthesis